MTFRAAAVLKTHKYVYTEGKKQVEEGQYTQAQMQKHAYTNARQHQHRFIILRCPSRSHLITRDLEAQRKMINH